MPRWMHRCVALNTPLQINRKPKTVVANYYNDEMEYRGEREREKKKTKNEVRMKNRLANDEWSSSIVISGL